MRYILARLSQAFSIPFVLIAIFLDVVQASIDKNPVILILAMSFVAIITGIVIQKQTFREKNSLDFEETYKHDKDIVNSFNAAVKVCHEKTQAEMIAIAEKRSGDECVAINSILN
jgi:hypothetical protein